MIIEKTVDLVKQIYKIHKIVAPKATKAVVGLGYTCVEVSAYAYEPFLGLASTLPKLISKSHCSKNKFAGSLTNFSITELLNWSYGPPNLQKIIGIATLNGVSQHILKILNPYKKSKINLTELLDIKKTTKVKFIGLMKPLIKEISELTNLITIIEDSLSLKPELKKYKILQNINQLKDNELTTDILICTGTALINNTLEEILNKFKRRAQKIVLIGPTASMIPDILFDYGVDIVGGMEILDSQATIQVIQEGGGTQLFKKYGKKYNLIKE